MPRRNIETGLIIPPIVCTVPMNVGKGLLRGSKNQVLKGKIKPQISPIIDQRAGGDLTRRL